MKKRIKKFYCIGDSITNGARNEFYRNYVLELNYIFKDKNIIFLNSSVNGETTSEILKRAIKIIANEDITGIFFLGGTNDTKISLPTSIFEKNIKTLIGLCRKFDINLILGTIPRIFTGLPAYSKNNGNLFVSKYNKILKKNAKLHDISIVDLNILTEDFFIDGIHTSNKGCEKIAKLIKNYI